MQNPTITPEMVKLAGITIPDDEMDDFLAYTNEQLDERVGAAVTDLLDDEQLEALLDLQEAGSNEEVLAWIHENVTDLDKVVQDEISILLADVAQDKDVINSSI